MLYQHFNFQTKKKSCNILSQLLKKNRLIFQRNFQTEKKSNKILMQFCNNILQKIYFSISN